MSRRLNIEVDMEIVGDNGECPNEETVTLAERAAIASIEALLRRQTFLPLDTILSCLKISVTAPVQVEQKLAA